MFYQVMEAARGRFTIVPIMVGSLSPSLEAKYGKILAKYLEVRDHILAKYGKILAKYLEVRDHLSQTPRGRNNFSQMGRF